MPVSDQAPDVRARTHMNPPPTRNRATSENGHSRPQLRVVTDRTHIPATPQRPPVAGHAADIATQVADHHLARTLPPTLAEAANNLWLDPDDTRHGLAGQLAAAAAGLAQLLILAACWGVAHTLAASKTRAAIAVLLLAAAAVAYLIATHA